MALCILLLLIFLILGHKWSAVEWLHGLSIRPFHRITIIIVIFESNYVEKQNVQTEKTTL